MSIKKVLKVAALPGDGIGIDVMEAVIPIFKALDISAEIKFGEIGWECWKLGGDPIPKVTWDLIHDSDVVLLGAITSKPEREALAELSPDLKHSEHKYISPVIQLRQGLDLYANFRPCFNIKDDAVKFDFCIVRENTEGLYSGFDYYPAPKQIESLIKENPRWQDSCLEDLSCSLRLQSKSGLYRIFNSAFQYAHRRNISRVTLADKPNVLRNSSQHARSIFEEVSSDFPKIKADILNVDAIALWMIRRPEEFGVIVAENMFGDILSDLGAGVMGGLGFASSANIGLNGCYFEPVHGSAPRIGKNLANPSAMFLTVGLMLEHFGHQDKAANILKAVKKVVKTGKYLTYDLGGRHSTFEMARAIIDSCVKEKENQFA
jgi:isocitrate/isopropylmalate dehydrogenase